MWVGGNNDTAVELLGSLSKPFRYAKSQQIRTLSAVSGAWMTPTALKKVSFPWSGGHFGAPRWSSAGQMGEIKPGGRWLATSVPRADWPKQAERFKESRHGDRRTEIVFIGAESGHKSLSFEAFSPLIL